MNKPTGKLLFAYQTIATLEQKLATLEAENAKLRKELERLPVDGWKLVPVEPTPEMLDAATQDGICVDGKPVWKKDVVFQAKWKYQQMLAAAPSAPKADAALSAPRQPEGEAASILLPALRQYMHNDGSGLLAGYEYERTQRIVAELQEERNTLRIVAGSVCGERDTLRQQRDKLTGLLRDARELIDHGDFREGWCMCGSGVEGHSLGDGHTPVDAGEYYAGQVRERIDAALVEVNK